MVSPVQARIVVTQANSQPPAGYFAGGRDGLQLDTVITCTNLNDAGVVYRRWEVFPAIGVPLATYAVAGLEGPELTLTPPSPLGFGDVAVRLTVYGEPLPGGRPNVSIDEVVLGVRAPSGIYAPGIPVPHPHESTLGGQTALDPAVGREGRVAELARALAMGAGGGALLIPAEWVFTLSGVYDQALVPGVFDPPRRAATTRTISRVELVRRTAGAAGTTRLDVKKNGTSIFGSPPLYPHVSAIDGDYATVSVATFKEDGATLFAGDILEVSLEETETHLIGPSEGPEGLTLTVFFSS